ncbi:MAG: hypothetical protein Ct9H300mP15_29900 [Gemmatimonadota bacterium]|nr:MAG: hypothetical protein Ct9H300mP15_29900 [Gemmatimonadota bacterium]
MLLETYSMSGDNWLWAEAHFDRLAGTDSLRLSIEAGADFAELTSAWESENQAFEQLEIPYLIYDNQVLLSAYRHPYYCVKTLRCTPSRIRIFSEKRLLL